MGRVEVHVVEFATGAAVLAANVSLEIPAGAGITQWFSAGAFPDNTTHAMTLEIFEDAAAGVGANAVASGLVAHNTILLAAPKHLVLPASKPQKKN